MCVWVPPIGLGVGGVGGLASYSCRGGIVRGCSTCFGCAVRCGRFTTCLVAVAPGGLDIAPPAGDPLALVSSAAALVAALVVVVVVVVMASHDRGSVGGTHGRSMDIQHGLLLLSLPQGSLAVGVGLARGGINGSVLSDG